MKRNLLCTAMAVLLAVILLCAGAVAFLNEHPFVEIPENAAEFMTEERMNALRRSADYAFGLFSIRVVTADENAVSAVFTYLPFGAQLGCTFYYREDGGMDYGEYWKP